MTLSPRSPQWPGASPLGAEHKGPLWSPCGNFNWLDFMHVLYTVITAAVSSYLQLLWPHQMIVFHKIPPHPLAPTFFLPPLLAMFPEPFGGGVVVV